MFPIRDLNPTRSTPVLTLLLIAANIAVFAFWQPLGDVGEEAAFLYANAAVPCEITQGRPLAVIEWQTGDCREDPAGPLLFPDKSPTLSLIVSMFLHGSWLHVLGNMWFLWIFGDNIEHELGRVRAAFLYLSAGLIGTAAFVSLHPTETVPLIGASGAVAGILGAYLVLHPGALVLAWAVIIVPVPAVIFLGLWFLAQFLVASPGVAWEAHVGGFIAGMGGALVLGKALPGRPRRRRGRG